MLVEQREQVTHITWSQRETGGTPCRDGRRQPSLGGTSRMNREIHVRIRGRLGVKFPGPTRQNQILRGQIKGRLLLSEGEKATLAEIAHRLGRVVLEDVAATAKPDTILGWYRSSSRTNSMGRNSVEV